MLATGLLKDVAVVLAASFPVLYLARRLRLPTIVGFLVTGVVSGPHALGLISDAQRVEHIAELGVVLILFFAGIHFPLSRLRDLSKTAVPGGFLQLTLTTGLVVLLTGFAGTPLRQAIFYGFLVTLSSTAVLLPVIAARDEMGSPYARRFLGVSLFQDLAVIPLVLLLPALAPAGVGPAAGAVLLKVGFALLGITLFVATARALLPRLLDGLFRLGSKEGFTDGVIVLVLVVIALSEEAGISAAMGAFAAGIVLGESEYVHEITSALAPFRDVLSSLFFVSIGMLLDPVFAMQNIVLVLLVVTAVVAVKVAAAFGALRAIGTSARTSLRTALALAPVGEFSFVLATAGLPLGLLTESSQQLFVVTAVTTLALAPLLVAWAPRLLTLLADTPEVATGEHHASLKGHVVIVGYGLNGRNVARALLEIGVPHVVLEADPDRVAAARADGVRAITTDATAPEGLDAAGVPGAVAVVLTIPDPDSARRSAQLCRRLSPTARILVRTRYVREVEALLKGGADYVIPEEFETSVEIVSRVLRILHVPGNVVATQIRLLRDEGYRRLREAGAHPSDARRMEALVNAGTTELFLVMPDTCADGRTLAALDLESLHVAVPALLRDGKPLAPPPRDVVITAGDTLLLVGAHEDLATAMKKLEESRAG